MQPASLQRGGATLAATLVLLFVMTLAAAYANRLHLVELHASTNQLQASQSFEAAEAGLEWAVAMLNEARPVDESCRPAAAATATFRERHLRRASAAQPFVVAPLQAACVHRDGAWRCHCPAAGDAVPPAAPDGDATPAPSFAVQLAASPLPGLVQLVATGCLGACTEPAARVQTTLGFVPAIATLPAAPLTVHDDVVTDAALALRNADAAGSGIALQAGGALLAPHARLGAPPGAPGPTVADHDAALHALAPDRLFATMFGLDKAVWQQQPGVARIRCERPCNDSVRRAAATHRLLWIDGDLPLDGPLAVGSPERPVLIVADGAVQFAGPVSVHGLVYASDAGWDDAAASSGALLRGALVSDSGWRGNAAPDLVYDAGILRALRADTGSFARLPGTWKDF